MAQIRPASQGSEGLRRERTLASPQFADGVFRNPSGLGPELQGGTLPVLGEYLFGGSRERSPKGVLPIERPHEAWLRAPETGFRTTWLGHSTVLLEIDGYRVLTDPVFGMRASPLGFAGPKRFHPTPASIHELPPLDAVVLSHNHYDHLCAESIAALAEVDVPIITALGVGAALSRIGIPESRIVELDWGDETWVRGLRICGTPAQHFSGRGVADRNRTLWMSIVLQTDKRKVFFSGDTGLTEQFLDIGTLHGPFDLVMLEVGAFHPSWGTIHLGPENALKAFRMLGGGTLLPVHWGTFNLALHAWNEPAETLVTLAADTGARVITPRLGAPIEPDRVATPDTWWREALAPKPACGSLIEPAAAT